MKIILNNPPRNYSCGLKNQICISDCGSVYLNPDEQLTFRTEGGKEYDLAAKEWGYYATPSINGRLKSFNYKTALVKNIFNKYFIMLVDDNKLELFSDYCKEESLEIIEWLDEK
jgi:hypothetical protein